MVTPSAPIDIERCKKWWFLKYYLPVYTMIISNNFPTFYYIDLMAGPGEKDSSIGVQVGSPIIALKAAERYYPFTDYILNDLRYSKELEDTINAFFEKHGSLTTRHKVGDKTEEFEVTRTQVNILSKPASEVVEEDVSKISEKTPCFFFIDPEGISEVPWDTTIKPCIKRKKTEVLLLYCTRGVSGCITVPKDHRTVDAFFGDSGWRKFVDTDSCRESLVDYYMSNIGKYKKFVFQTAPITNKRNSEIYRLIFATDNDKAKKIWEDYALSRVNELWKEREYREWLSSNFGSDLTDWIS